MTMTAPRLEVRPEQPYVGIRADLTMDDLQADTVVPGLIGEIEGWLARHGVTPVGPPFIRYHVIDMAASLDVEVGFPTDGVVAGDGRVEPATLPAGRYAALVYTGAEHGVAANRALIEWAAEHGVAFDDFASERGHGFRGRYETLLTDPADEDDPTRWRTEVAILVAPSS
jgi:effector-binding domain-containing protein